MRARRAALPISRRLQMQTALIPFGMSCLNPWNSVSVAMWSPIRGELDPGGLGKALEAAGARLCLPRIEGGDITFRHYNSDTILAPGPHGLLEPTEASPLVVPEVIFAPLLAFDTRGGRLGYGGGYYDRAIARCRPCLAIGLAFSLQEVPAVPVGPDDRLLDLVVTDAGVIDCRM